MKSCLLAAAAAVAFLGGVAPVQASPITYTETATATGVLKGIPFWDALVTITFAGDTSNVADFGNDCPSCLVNVPAASATVNVLGVGTDTFTDTIGIIGFPALTPDLGNMAGVAMVDAAPGTSGLLILATISNGLLGYDLSSAIGPISGGAMIEGNAVYTTTSGSFQWTSSPATATFTATVPEPGSMVLLVMGLIVLGLIQRTGDLRRSSVRSFFCLTGH